MQKIRKIRKAAKLSVGDLSKMIGVKNAAFYHYENGIRTPDICQCWRIVNALNKLGAICSFEEVFPNPESNDQ